MSIKRDPISKRPIIDFNKKKKRLTPAELHNRAIVERQGYKDKASEWQRLTIYSDIIALANTLKVSANTISKAINKGEGGLEILRAVNDFYAERLKLKAKNQSTLKQP